MDSTDFLCPPQCCVSRIEDIPVLIVPSTKFPCYPAAIAQKPTNVFDEHRGKRCSLNSAAVSTGKHVDPGKTNHQIPTESPKEICKQDLQSTSHTRKTRIKQRVSSQPPQSQCVCHSWENWRRLFITVLVLCFIIFIVSDLYYLSHVELIAPGLQMSPGLLQLTKVMKTNMTTYAMRNVNGRFLDTYIMRPGLSSFAPQHNSVPQQRLLNRDLQITNISDDLLLCARRWKLDWNKKNWEPVSMEGNHVVVQSKQR